jgi:hypothetical protein
VASTRPRSTANNVAMPGASEQTRKVKALNANWSAGTDGGDGRFEIMLVTEDDQQHTMPVSPSSMTALVALSQADGVLLLWDPADSTMIVANIVGQWVPRPEGSAADGST